MKSLVHATSTPALAVALLGATGGAQTLLFERYGSAASDQLGTAVASVGDVDGDGVEDWAVGAPLDDSAGSNAGLVRVYSGRSLQVLHAWTGTGAGQRFGQSVATAGDIDGDGKADLIVGAPGGTGRAFVRSGATGSVLHTLSGGSGDDFGRAVAGGGLVDADQVPDLLVGEPYADAGGNWRGRAYVFSGSTGATIRTHDGAADWKLLGAAAAFIDDRDGDGRREYALGAIGYCSLANNSQVRAFDGATGAAAWTNTASGTDQYGFAIAALSDVTGDGVDEVVAGAMQDGGIGCAGLGRGYVRALDGATGATLYQVNGLYAYHGLGWAVTALGDLNGNGYEDFAAGQPGTEGCGGTSAGPVEIREGLDGTRILLLPAPSGSQQFGASLASGDANGDGLRDLIVGAPCSTSNGSYAGTVYVYTLVRSVVSFCESEANSLGCTPSIGGVGTPSATLASPFDVRATSVLNQKSGLCFYGFKPRQTPFQGGHMCIVAPTTRTPIQSSGGTPSGNDCTGVFSLDFNARIQSGVDPLLVAGEEVFAQYWSRDPADASTTNLTDALAFYIQP